MDSLMAFLDAPLPRGAYPKQPDTLSVDQDQLVLVQDSVPKVSLPKPKIKEEKKVPEAEQVKDKKPKEDKAEQPDVEALTLLFEELNKKPKKDKRKDKKDKKKDKKKRKGTVQDHQKSLAASQYKVMWKDLLCLKSREPVLGSSWRMDSLLSKYKSLEARELSSLLEAGSSETCSEKLTELIEQHVSSIGNALVETGSVEETLSKKDPVFALLLEEDQTGTAESLKKARASAADYLQTKALDLGRPAYAREVLASYSEIYGCQRVPWSSVHPQKIRDAMRATVLDPSSEIPEETSRKIDDLALVLGCWLNDQLYQFDQAFVAETENDEAAVSGLPWEEGTQKSKEVFARIREEVPYVKALSQTFG